MSTACRITLPRFARLGHPFAIRRQRWWWLLVPGLLIPRPLLPDGRLLANEHPPSGSPADSVRLAEPALVESSGLAASRRRPARFWSHNDSGGEPRLYAFDAAGNRTGQVRLPSVTAHDWEDMACFVQDGVPRLLVADCGDNQARRDSIILYLFDEPDPDRDTVASSLQQVTVRYSDGPRDCEAVAVDPDRGQIILIAKSRLPLAGIYTVPLPTPNLRGGETTAVAHRRGTLPLPMISAIDRCGRTGDLWVVNYFQAFRFARADREEPIAAQLSRTPVSRDLPRLRQIEAAAVDPAGRLWVTTEGSPAIMAAVPERPQRRDATEPGASQPSAK
jgi:hypothetical protein